MRFEICFVVFFVAILPRVSCPISFRTRTPSTEMTTPSTTRRRTRTPSTSTIPSTTSTFDSTLASASATTTTDDEDDEEPSTLTSASSSTSPSDHRMLSDVQTTKDQPPLETTTPLEPENWIIYVGITISIIVFGILLGILVIWALKYYAKKKLQKDGGYKPLKDTYKDNENTMDMACLVRTAGRVIASQTKAEEFVAKIADPVAEKLDEKQGPFVTMDHVRLPGLKLRKSTRVMLHGLRKGGARLHMTRLHDYYGNTLLLCQAPLPNQFVDQWKAIWQERIGVVVWIGPFSENEEPKLDPYIALKEGSRIRCGDFTLETTLAVRKPLEYDSFLVEAKKRRGGTHLITFLHLHMWPDSGAPLAPAKLADFVERLQEQQQLKATQHNLPGLLMHCSAGVLRSPTLMGVYIARQMWIAEKKINMLGIFRYIRRQRYKTLLMGNAALQVQVAFGVMQVIAIRREMGKISALNVEAHERNVFDPRLRREEIDGDTTLASYVSAKTADLEAAYFELESKRKDSKLVSTSSYGKTLMDVKTAIIGASSKDKSELKAVTAKEDRSDGSMSQPKSLLTTTGRSAKS